MVKLPEWLQSLAPLSSYVDELTDVGGVVSRYGSLEAAVVAFVATWIIGGFLDLTRVVVDAVTMAFEPVAGLAADFARIVGGGLEPLASVLFTLPEILGQSLGEVSASLGPWAPVVIVPAGVAVAYLVWEGLKRVPGVLWVLYNAIPGT